MRRRRMKHIDFKRVFAIACIVCVFLLFAYFYWQQQSPSPDNIIYRYKQIYRPVKKSNQPQWTWLCIDKRCERHSIKTGVPIISQATCGMQCGSTQLWPQPRGPIYFGSRAATFNHHQFVFEISAAEPAYSLVQQSLASFNTNIINMIQRDDYDKDKTDLEQFLVRVEVQDSLDVKLKLSTDESYSVIVKTQKERTSATVTAKTFFGARHGLETLSQLIWWDGYKNGGVLKVLKGATIRDRPAFPYRGLMIDTARNFMSIDALKRVLIGMAANKLNVLHWHITDSQSFPLVLPDLPLLAKTGAYDPTMTYTPEEVRGLVEFGRINGIRIILEVDTPAHAGNGWTWGPEEGLGELAVCVNEKPWSLYCGEPPCGQLNPNNPHVYTILEKLYRNLLELNSDNEIFHLGGDEVNLECWGQLLQNSKTPNNFTDLHHLWGYFTQQALKRLEAANDNKPIPNIIVWSSNLSKRPYISKYLNKSNIVVQSWGASQWPDTSELISDGYRVIISHVDAWYLDCGFGRWRETGEAACDPYRPWQTVYNHKPWLEKKEFVLGGEACLWSEQVDEGSLDARLWPRAAAFAERVWSDPPLLSLTIDSDVYTRLNTQRDRLVSRGLGAEVLWPEWCRQNPGMCL